MRRIGRPTKYVTGRDGREVVGLSFHKPSGRYYATHNKPRVYFGSDFDTALIRFREWESRQKGVKVSIPDTSDKGFTFTDETATSLRDRDRKGLTDYSDKWYATLDENDFWAFVRAAILKDP